MISDVYDSMARDEILDCLRDVQRELVTSAALARKHRKRARAWKRAAKLWKGRTEHEEIGRAHDDAELALLRTVNAAAQNLFKAIDADECDLTVELDALRAAVNAGRVES